MNQEKIGKFIANRRKDKMLTQMELAQKLGVSDRTVSNWENGKNMPDLSLFKPLCDELGITINELMSGEIISKKEYNEKLEQNIINTIDYIDKKYIYNNDIKSIIWLLIGILAMIISSLFINKYEVSNYINIVSLILIIHSLKRLCVKHKLVRKIIACILFIISLISIAILK